MSFTPDEITASVEKIVLASIRRPYDTLGTRRVDVSFSDTQEAAAGLFLTMTSAPFYVAFLGAQRLLDVVEAEMVLVVSAMEAINATGRAVYPVKDLTPLGNARSALFELEAAVGARSKGFKSIETVPAYQRFQANLQQFLTSEGKNIKEGGAIVQTPQEARAVLGVIIGELDDIHADLVRKVGLLAGALDDFSSLNLPALAASGVISKARKLLDADLTKLEGLGEKERLAVLRPIMLDLLTSKAVVKKYGSFLAPPTFLSLTGTGTPFADATHPAALGGVTGDKKGPFPVALGANTIDVRLDAVVAAKVVGTVDSIGQFFSGPQLLPFKATFNRAAGSFITDGVIIGDVIYVLDGPNINTRWTVTLVGTNTLEAVGSALTQVAGASLVQIWPKADESIPLASSYVASVEGSLREPFVIDAASQAFSFFVDGFPVSGSFLTGSHPAADLCLILNGALGLVGLNSSVVAEPYLSPVKFDGIVDVVVGVDATWTLQAGQLDGLGISVGDVIQVMSGPDFGEVFAITAVDLAAPITFFSTSNVGVTAGTGVRINIGPAGRKIRLRFLDPPTAIAGRRRFTVGDGLSSPANAIIGWPNNAVFTSKPTHARDLVTDYNGKVTKSQAERVFSQVSTLTTFRSRPDTNLVAVLYRFRGTCNVIGAVNTIFIDVPGGGLTIEPIDVGDKLVLRTGQGIDVVWTITTKSDTLLTATGVGTSITQSNVEFEVGPPLVITPGMLMVVEAGPNIGEYYVSASRPIPFEMSLEAVLPVFKDGFSAPVFFTAQLLEESIKISSKTALTNSRATINGVGARLLNTSVPYSGGSTTTWFKLPTMPADLRTGDFLDIHATDYQTATESFAITAIEPELLLIQLDHGIDSVAAHVFGSIPVPFARLRSLRVFDFTGLQKALTTWLALPEQQPGFFTDLNRFINPLLVTENPTDTQIGAAKTKVLALAGVLNEAGAALAVADPAATLQVALDSYAVEPIPEVDALLRSFKEKGSDRAIDLLLEGQFTTFFGLDIDEASYAGDMQKKLREMAREDLPVRKTGRSESNASQHVAEIEDVDYEYDQSDIGDVQIDPPPEALDE